VSKMKGIRKHVGLAASYVTLVIFSVWILLPLVWAFTLSIKTPQDILSIPNQFIFWPTLENYLSVFQKGEFMHQFSNSLIIGVSSTILALLIGIPAAYTLSRYHFRGSSDLQFWVLSTRMAPPVAVLIPYFLFFQRLNLIDTYPAIILMHLSVNLVLVIWLMKGFFADIPDELSEAALVDGCTHWGAFLRICLPLAKGGVVATSILAFIFSWNELMFALVLSGSSVKTAPVGVFNFIGFEEVAWGPLMAASMVLLVPIVVFVSLVQRALVRGLTFGAVKG
jgi:multiple sugar transport system permease protein